MRYAEKLKKLKFLPEHKFEGLYLSISIHSTTLMYKRVQLVIVNFFRNVLCVYETTA